MNLLWNTEEIVEPINDHGFYYGKYRDVCLYGCPTEIYNECYGEEGESLERCISDKEYEQKVLDNYK